MYENINFPEGVTYKYKYYNICDLADKIQDGMPCGATSCFLRGEFDNNCSADHFTSAKFIIPPYSPRRVLFNLPKGAPISASYFLGGHPSVTGGIGYSAYITGWKDIEFSKVTNMCGMFNSFNFVVSQEKLYPDIPDGTTSDYDYLKILNKIDTSSVTDMSSLFSYARMWEAPAFNTSKVENMYYIFGGIYNIRKIPLYDCTCVSNMSNVFGSSTQTILTDVGGFKNLKVSITSGFLDKCPNVTVESLMNVLNNLYDWTGNTDGKVTNPNGKTVSYGTTHKIALGSTNLAKLSDEQKAVATNKGWVLA